MKVMKHQGGSECAGSDPLQPRGKGEGKGKGKESTAATNYQINENQGLCDCISAKWSSGGEDGDS